MALAHALLAALHQEPGTGYELTRRFELSMGNFWQASHQQIYRELSRMAQQGWLELQLQPQQGKPTRKVYSVTPTGLAALRDWLQQPQPPAVMRDDLLVKLYAGAEDPAAVQAELRRHRALHADKLATYQALEAGYFASPQDLPRSERFIYLTLRAGLSYERQWLAWCDETLSALQELG